MTVCGTWPQYSSRATVVRVWVRAYCMLHQHTCVLCFVHVLKNKIVSLIYNGVLLVVKDCFNHGGTFNNFLTSSRRQDNARATRVSRQVVGRTTRRRRNVQHPDEYVTRRNSGCQHFVERGRQHLISPAGAPRAAERSPVVEDPLGYGTRRLFQGARAPHWRLLLGYLVLPVFVTFLGVQVCA